MAFSSGARPGSCEILAPIGAGGWVRPTAPGTPAHLHPADVDRHETTDYLVMEYLEAATLSARLACGPPPQEELLHYAFQIAQALAHVHQNAGTLIRLQEEGWEVQHRLDDPRRLRIDGVGADGRPRAFSKLTYS